MAKEPNEIMTKEGKSRVNGNIMATAISLNSIK
jgi:hypothetical protein